MSQSRFDDQDQQLRRISGVINGPRPSPLRIHKDSHAIHKQSSSSSSYNNHVNRKPVIIYTQSPKIIHTQPRDFMALVQKLTGVSRPSDGPPARNEPRKSENERLGPVGHEDNESSSVLTDDNNSSGDVKECLASVSPMFNATNPLFGDIPLFTPNTNEFFCSPRPLFRFSNMVSPSQNMGNSTSPSFMEILRGLP